MDDGSTRMQGTRPGAREEGCKIFHGLLYEKGLSLILGGWAQEGMARKAGPAVRRGRRKDDIKIIELEGEWTVGWILNYLKQLENSQ